MNRITHPSERTVADIFPSAPAQCRIEALTRCWCFSSSSSKSEQSSSSISGGSVVGDKAASAGDFSSVQTGGARNEGSGMQVADSTITISGIQGDALTGLVGLLTKASSKQISQVLESGAKNVSTLGELLAQEKDAQAGNPKTMAYVALAAVGAFVVVILFRKS